MPVHALHRVEPGPAFPSNPLNHTFTTMRRCFIGSGSSSSRASRAQEHERAQQSQETQRSTSPDRSALLHEIDSSLQALSLNRSRIDSVLQHETSSLIPPRDRQSLERARAATDYDRYRLGMEQGVLHGRITGAPHSDPYEAAAEAYRVVNRAHRHLSHVDDRGVLDDREVARGLYESHPEFRYPDARD